MPTDPYARAKTRALLGFHDTRLEASARTLFPLVKSDWRANPDALDEGIVGIEAALERLAALIDPSPFIHGRAPSLADIAYPCTLQMAEMLASEMERPFDVPKAIADWRDETAGIDAVARSLTITRDAMETWLAGFR